MAYQLSVWQGNLRSWPLQTVAYQLPVWQGVGLSYSVRKKIFSAYFSIESVVIILNHFVLPVTCYASHSGWLNSYRYLCICASRKQSTHSPKKSARASRVVIQAFFARTSKQALLQTKNKRLGATLSFINSVQTVGISHYSVLEMPWFYASFRV